MKAFKKKERGELTQFTYNTDGVLSFHPIWMLMYFLQVFFKCHPMYDQTQGSGAMCPAVLKGLH
jgi:hypothetical protein